MGHPMQNKSAFMLTGYYFSAVECCLEQLLPKYRKQFPLLGNDVEVTTRPVFHSRFALHYPSTEYYGPSVWPQVSTKPKSGHLNPKKQKLPEQKKKKKIAYNLI